MIRRKFLRRTLRLAGLLAAFIYFNNASWLADPLPGGPLLLAHRGVSQTFSLEGLTHDTDTSKRIHPPEHPYLENTLDSMAAAFRCGADVVEIDIHPTTDGKFAVFHDWILDYRTDGRGVTREHSMADLKKLDIGYGYTADGGKTFPFRGKAVGLMPSLDEVLAAFPDREFLINIKSADPDEGKKLAVFLKQLPEARRKRLAAYGSDVPIAGLQRELPDFRTMSKAGLKRGLIPYLALGWTGYVPKACKNTQIHVPEKYAPLLWGWPNRFLRRMDAVGTRVILIGGDGEFARGFDSVEDLKRLPEEYSGGIWTNRIDRIGPRYRPDASLDPKP